MPVINISFDYNDADLDINPKQKDVIILMAIEIFAIKGWNLSFNYVDDDFTIDYLH